MAFSSTLPQVQNGEERPIAYASRQTNKAEQSCAATELEMLSLVLDDHAIDLLHTRLEVRSKN